MPSPLKFVTITTYLLEFNHVWCIFNFSAIEGKSSTVCFVFVYLFVIEINYIVIKYENKEKH